MNFYLSDMAKKLDPMDLYQILSFCNDGLSRRLIGELLKISRLPIDRCTKMEKLVGLPDEESVHEN